MVLAAQMTSNTALFLFIGAVAVTTWILLMRSHRYFARQKQAESSSRAATPDAIYEERGRHLDAPSAMARWEVQMHDTAREASAQLDSKMSALQALIADADRAAARLEAALASAPEAAPGADQSRPTSQAEALQPHAAELGSPDRRQQIYTLADYGFEPAEIARRVASPIGEVELILGLREKK